MSIGYACLTIGVPDTKLKNCILKNASHSKLLEIIDHNLSSLENMIDYNIKNNIILFRISSDLIPFGSSEFNNLAWWDIFATKLHKIGEKIQKSGMRVSMHPGQYTVLNSPREDVVSKSILELDYHAKLLDSLHVGTEHKIVLHIGGVYNEKEQSIERFIRNYSRLEEAVKRRLVIENDDKSYHISDVLEISSKLNIPVIFDNLHNKVNPSPVQESEVYWINECKKTWKATDGNQKIHYSQQNPLKQQGSHSERIKIAEFLSFYNKLCRDDIDIMLEVKDKNLSAVKCINCTSQENNIKLLELEWSKYKYSVLEKSHSDYSSIRLLLRDKKEYPAVPFYTILEETLQKEMTIGNSINAAQHVWGYFKDVATEKEKNKFIKDIDMFANGEISINKIKNSLLRMAEKYQRTYLLESYYFYI